MRFRSSLPLTLSSLLRVLTLIESFNTQISICSTTTSSSSSELHAGVQLSESNFDNLTGTGQWFVEHFSPFCAHCKKFAPTWIKLNEQVKPFQSRGLSMGQIDCIAQGDLCVRLDIEYYPQMKLIEDGKVVESYSGPRVLDDLTKYLDLKSNNYSTLHHLSDLNQTSELTSTNKVSLDPTRTHKDLEEKLNLNGSDNELLLHSRLVETPNRDGKVIHLSKEDLLNYINSDSIHGPVFVKYYAPWCGHCRKLAPVWKDLAKSLINTVNVVEFDCEDPRNKLICKDEEVSYFPTLSFYQDGTKVNYKGPRTIGGLDNFARRAAASAGTKEIGIEDFKSLLTRESVFFLLVYTPETEKSTINLVQNIAKSFLGTALVYKTSATQLKEHFRVSTGSSKLLVFKDSEEEPWDTFQLSQSNSSIPLPMKAYESTTKSQSSSIQRFLSSNNLPLLSELNSLNFETIIKASGPRLIVLACFNKGIRTDGGGKGDRDLDDAKTQLKVWARQWRMSQLARKVETTVDWVWVDAEEWKDWLFSNYGIDPVRSKASSINSKIIVIEPSKGIFYDRQANGYLIGWKSTSIFQTLLAVELGKVQHRVSGTFFDRMIWVSFFNRVSFFFSFLNFLIIKFL
ncbi:thioredoxin-like protein [Phakopsora pachyrhizi]|uniref:Thioredoxin-like protein n=1 Tax=Phakopsora pachyrhizi TaxID=170000 RepID=A0AAV0ANP8_PHAPC|nr:thioredoxin-like protein [Phakopsora pachyrhizi]